jgi:S1-C subfamily serine protease
VNLRTPALILAAAALIPAGARAQTAPGATRTMVHQLPAGHAPLGFGWAVTPRPRPDGSLGYSYPVIREVTEGSAAARAGLAVGDTLLTVNGRDARLPPFFPNRTAGVRYVLRVRRGDEERELTYVYPAPPAPKS